MMRWLLIFSLLAVSCGGLEEDDSMPQLSPWAMWGNAQTIQLVGTAGTQTNANTQLCRVSYGRPETWSFLFTAKLMAVSPDVAATGINLFWDVTTGVGRAQTTIQGFETYAFSWLAGGGTALVGSQYRTSSVIVPARNHFSTAADPYPNVPNIIDKLVAEDIQVAVRSTMAPAAGEHVAIEVSAFFVPASHIRPEWYQGRFPGGETEGH